MAFSPNGVAALSSPNILAEMFMKMFPMTGWFLGMSGKSLQKSGLRPRARMWTTPPFSPIFMMPIHSESTPFRPREISKAVLAELNVESMMAGNTPASPANTNFPAAMRNAMPKNATQM